MIFTVYIEIFSLDVMRLQGGALESHDSTRLKSSEMESTITRELGEDMRGQIALFWFADGSAQALGVAYLT